MNPIAEYAYATLARTQPGNEHGEVKGLGPTWSCNNYAGPGHNYNTCTVCFDNFMARETAHKK